MSGPVLTVEVFDKASPRVRSLLLGLSAQGRTRLHGFVGRSVQHEVRDYLILQAATRHVTANRLGATPTGFLGDMAQQVSAATALTADDQAARLQLPRMLARAFGDVHITPKNGSQYLTLPIAAESYGQRIQRGGSSRFTGGFFFTSKKGNLLYGVRDKSRPGGINPLYLLKTSVDQKQDRTLVSSDEALKAAGLEGAAAGVAEMMKAARN